jgi:hypothetical protein
MGWDPPSGGEEKEDRANDSFPTGSFRVRSCLEEELSNENFMTHFGIVLLLRMLLIYPFLGQGLLITSYQASSFKIFRFHRLLSRSRSPHISHGLVLLGHGLSPLIPFDS